jgi:hypothetical protein
VVVAHNSVVLDQTVVPVVVVPVVALLPLVQVVRVFPAKGIVAEMALIKPPVTTTVAVAVAQPVWE